MVWKQFLSTTTSPMTAEEFAPKPGTGEWAVYFLIRVLKPTTSQLPCYAPAEIARYDEGEVLFPPHVAVKIVEVTTIGELVQRNHMIDQDVPKDWSADKWTPGQKFPEDWLPDVWLEGKPTFSRHSLKPLLIICETVGYDTDNGILDAKGEMLAGKSISHPIEIRI